jgi:DNA-binding NtrC family response regulator
MSAAFVLLISSDSTFEETVRGLVATIGRLSLKVLDPGTQAGCRLGEPDLGLVLLHVTGEADRAQALAVLRQASARPQPVATLVVSDRYRAAEALEFLRQGAVDYLSRPLDLTRLAFLTDLLTVRFRYGPAAARAPWAVEALGEEDAFMYCPSGGMGQIIDQIRRVAPQDTTILLGGETGTGKTRLARLIHELSPRRGQPFLTINCGALSETLIESEMFGHSRGAFTGADRDRTGKFAEVGCGTLLLDEIDALPPTLQAKFLRAVEERVFEPIGSNKTLRVRARLVAASNRRLDEEVAAGRFRGDLYYRLNVIGFVLPPLRERRHLIGPLAEKFLGDFSARNGRPTLALGADALQALNAYDWPGNIRELRNAMERAAALRDGAQVQVQDLPVPLWPEGTAAAPGPAYTPPGATGILVQTKEEAEALCIAEALRRNNNNRLRAAAELGISRMTLYKKLHRYGLMTVG